MKPVQAVVLGNAALDILCYPVDDVPRYDSISFEQSIVSPGGCGSNVSIGLCSLGISTALIACLGNDSAADLAEQFWERTGLNRKFLRRIPGVSTGISVGLIDHDFQPRFIHATGANDSLTAADIDIDQLASEGAKAFHIAGYFVLPGLLDTRLPEKLAQARQRGLMISLDVVQSPRMDHPEMLWPCLPHLDVFLCNADEATRLTGIREPGEAAAEFCRLGAEAAIVKLGEQGCWLESQEWRGRIAAQRVKIIDTTGAGDAFAAGFISARLHGMDLPSACREANKAGSKAVGAFGAVSAWLHHESS